METLNLNLHIEPKVMQQAERILAAIGISTESAVDMLFRQIIIKNGLPFDTRLPAPSHLCADLMTQDEFDNAIQAAKDSISATGGIPFEQAFDEIYAELDIEDV